MHVAFFFRSLQFLHFWTNSTLIFQRRPGAPSSLHLPVHGSGQSWWWSNSKSGVAGPSLQASHSKYFCFQDLPMCQGSFCAASLVWSELPIERNRVRRQILGTRVVCGFVPFLRLHPALPVFLEGPTIQPHGHAQSSHCFKSTHDSSKIGNETESRRSL